MLLKKSIQEYENYLKNTGKSPRTIKGYVYELTAFNDYLVRKTNMPAIVENITAKIINDYTLYLLTDKNYAPYSRRRIVIIQKAYFTYAYSEGMTEDKLSEKILSVKVPNKERKFLTAEEVQEFIGKVDNRLIRFALVTLYYTGMRISECCNLKMEDVDMRNRILHVVNGKGAKDRPIPICNKLYDLFTDYIANWRIDSDLFFSTGKTGVLAISTVEHTVAKVRDKLGWKNVTPHTFRHSFASSLVEKDVNLLKISKLLGHSSLKTTQIYIHTNISQLADAVNLL